MANTLRVSIQPNNGATKVIRIAQPTLRITFSKGAAGVALPREKVFGTAKVYGNYVTGYAVGSTPNTDTQAAIDYALAQGYPAWAIQWRYLGEQGDVAGSIGAASVSLRPVVAAGTLTGVLENVTGSIAAASVSLTPMVSVPSLVGAQVGSITAAALSLRPTVSAPSLIGVQVGSISAAPVSLTPSVFVGTLTGVQEGIGVIGAASVSLRPSVTAPDLTGVQVGSIGAASVALIPTVAAGIFYSGDLAPVSVTLNPTNGSTIVYTLDGTDPLGYIVASGGLATFDNGNLITQGDVR